MPWHYKNRACRRSRKSRVRDRAYNYVAEYRAVEDVIRLADDSMRNVTVSRKQSRWRFGTDDREYD